MLKKLKTELDGQLNSKVGGGISTYMNLFFVENGYHPLVDEESKNNLDLLKFYNAVGNLIDALTEGLNCFQQAF